MSSTPPIKTLGLHQVTVVLHPEVSAKVTINVARSAEEAERQARGENVLERETDNLDDLGLEIGAALGRSRPDGGDVIGKSEATLSGKPVKQKIR